MMFPTKKILARMILRRYPKLEYTESFMKMLYNQDKEHLMLAVNNMGPLACRLEVNERICITSGRPVDFLYETEDAITNLCNPEKLKGSFGECPDIEPGEHSARWIADRLEENNIIVRDALNEYKGIVKILCDKKVAWRDSRRSSRISFEKGVVYAVSTTPEYFTEALKHEAKRLNDPEIEKRYHTGIDFKGFLPGEWEDIWA